MIKSRLKWVGHVACMGEMRNVYKTFTGKPERKKPCGRQRHRLYDNIRKDLKEIGWESVDWIHLAQDKDQWQAPLNMVMILQVP